MTQREARGVVRQLRRHLLMAALTRALFVLLVALALVAALVPSTAERRIDAFGSSLSLAALAWVILAVIGAKQIYAANQASGYISTGRLDLAEERLKTAMQSFSVYRTGKLLICHNLAVIAHGRKNYLAAAELCDGVLSVGGKVSRHIARVCRMLLADCRLFLGDPASATRAIASLSFDDPSLSLWEQLMLLPIELRCQVAGGQYQKAVESLTLKVRRAELMEAPKAALVHALLARACRQVGSGAVADFLQHRAELYHDLHELAEEYPIVGDSSGQAPSTDHNVGHKP